MENKERTQLDIDKKNTDSDAIEIHLSDLLRGVLKYWWLCGIIVVVCTFVLTAFSFLRFTPIYNVSATFTVQTQETNALGSGITSYSYYYNHTTAKQLSDAFPYILESKLLQTAVCEDLNVDIMPASISATAIAGTNMFTMTAAGKNPQSTYDVLVSAMENYPSVAEYVIGTSKLVMISEPVIPDKPSNSRNTLQYMVIGCVIGIALSAAWIVFYAVFRDTIKTNQEVKEKLNQTCLGVLPHVTFKKHRKEFDNSILMVNSLTGDTFIESVKKVRNTLVSKTDGEIKSIMITSSAPGEGKTTVSVNLAISLAKMGKRVILVDADIRHPSVDEVLKNYTSISVPNDNPNISLKYIDELDMGVVHFNVTEKDMFEFMRTSYLKECFDACKIDSDYVIVDAPPCALTSDPVTIAGAVDASILVIKQDTIRTTRIKYAIDSLLSVDANIIGCILNSAAFGLSGYGYYYGGYGYKYGRYGYSKYGYGYGYGYDKEK